MSKINKAVDEAMRGLSSLKSDAMRTARAAGRQAAQEARKAGREGRKAFKFEFNIDLGCETSGDRPENDGDEPEEAQTSQSTITWTGADKLTLENKYGNITVIGAGPPSGNRRSDNHEDGLGRDRCRGAGSVAAGLFDQSSRKRPLQSRDRRTAGCQQASDGGL